MEHSSLSLYEIIEKIGSGGVGSVYLARHKNLDTKVIVKIEKLNKKVNEAQLRREVDILKTLKNPYIPIVYDYFIENNKAYTVMEYIEGENLQSYMSHGNMISQPMIIKWAIQLLEALKYLHSPTHGDPPRGYVHSDIKPGNIMIRPNGDISLIDFNVSRVLGEETLLGYTQGYASPEHYGVYYTGGSIKTHRLELDEDATVSVETAQLAGDAESTNTVPEGTGTGSTGTGSSPGSVVSGGSGISSGSVVSGGSGSSSGNLSGSSSGNLLGSSSQSSPYGSSTYRKRKIVPDERSDLYSVGALLYHLIAGVRPAANVLQVIPLSTRIHDPQLVAIIRKAMNADPDLRYQSAGEMLQAFYDLKKNDPRNKSLKRAAVFAVLLTAALMAAGVACAFVGLNRMQKKEEWLKLTEYSNKAYSEGDIEGALRYAVEACPGENNVMTPEIREETQLALTQALEVYKLSDGYRVDRIAQLPSEPLFADVSPDGKMAAVICLGQLLIVDTGNSETVAMLDAEESALAEAEFIDSETLLYAGREGLTAYDLKAGKELWRGRKATGIAVSGDGKTAAGIYKDEKKCYLYDVGTGETIHTIDLGANYQPVAVNNIGFNPNDNMLVLNQDGSRLGISLDQGTVKICDPENADNNIEIYDEQARFGHFEGAFYQDLFLFEGSDGDRAEIVGVDIFSQDIVYNRADFGLFHIAAGDDGIWASRDNRVLKYNPKTRDLEQYYAGNSPIKGISVCGGKIVAVSDTDIVTMDGEGSVLSLAERNDSTDIISISDATLLIGNYNSNIVQILKYTDMSDTICGLYDPSYLHYETRISADKSHLVVSTERDCSIYRVNGLRERYVEFPDPDQIYDQQFRRDGQNSALEITYYDGTVITYDGNTGKKIGTEQKAAPDRSLQETLETEHFTIENRIHQNPVVYDRASGRQIAEIGKDAYLTYADELDGYLVLRFITTDLTQYGCLYDDRCRIKARIPYMCDVYDGKMYMDYQDGALRETKAYKLDELVDMAKEELGQ